MWQARYIRQSYPWINGVQVKKKPLPPPTTVSATYGAGEGKSTAVTLSYPICISPWMDIRKTYGDPAYGFPKALDIGIIQADGKTSSIQLRECAGKWDEPLYYDVNATLDVVVNGGLSNQIYQIAAACIVAKKTRRRLAFPFQVLARKECLDPVGSYDKPSPTVVAPFRHLFDESHFIAHCGVDLCLLEEDDVSITAIITAKDAEGKVVGASEPIDQRFYSLGVPIASGTTLSSDIAAQCYLPTTHVSLAFPFVQISPSSKLDYDTMVNAIFALKPAPHLQIIADSIFTQFFTDPNLLAIHCRIEEDWKSTFPGLVIAPSGLIDTIKRTHAPSSIYVIGNTTNERYWRELKTKAPEYKWLRKEDFGVKDIGFEEGAVVDRDLACRAPLFLGFNASTLSLVVGLYRYSRDKQYAFYGISPGDGHMINNPLFLYRGGKPMREVLP